MQARVHKDASVIRRCSSALYARCRGWGGVGMGRSGKRVRIFDRSVVEIFSAKRFFFMDINKDTIIKQVQADLGVVKIIISKSEIEDAQINEYIRHIENGLSLLNNIKLP